ncbi:lipid A export permease/ATP-binding protein MsbA [Zooshikella ganghwensis]
MLESGALYHVIDRGIMSTDPNYPPQSGLSVYLRLLSYVKPYTGWFSISIVGYILFALSQPLFAKMMEYFVAGLEGSDTSLIYWVPIGTVIIALFRGLGSYLGNYFIARVSLGVVHDLRCGLFDQLVLLPNHYFDNHNSGHLISRITYNVGMVTGAATDAIKVVIREGFTVTFLLGFLFITNWKLSLIFVGMAPLIALVVSKAGKRFRKLSRKIQNAMGNVTHVASETINGYRVVRSFGGEDYEQKRFHEASSLNTKQNLKMVKTSAVHTPTLQFLVLTSLALLMFLVLFMRGDATAAELVGFVTAAGMLPKPIRQLSEVNATIQKGIAAAQSIFEQIDEPAEEDSGKHEVTRVEGRLQLNHLSFSYPNTEKVVLKGISLHIEPGETVALVGRSGSGKSTLASLIPRFYDNITGEILLDGIPIQQYKLRNLRQQIALVTQQVTLFNDTVANNIAYGDLQHRTQDEVKKAAEAAYAMEFIKDLPEGLNTLVGEDGVLLSGGQRQRLAIARAILKDAPLLILDEATSALDTESERMIQKALDQVMKGRTTIVIAHRLSTIENADKIVVMDKGEIVEVGTHQQLLQQSGHYAKLHHMQFKEEASESSDIAIN